MMTSSEEIFRLGLSRLPEDYHRITEDSASVDVWFDFIKKYPDCKHWVDTNRNTPREVLEYFVYHEDDDVRRIVTRHPNLSLRLIEKLCRDKDSTIRQNVACHSNITPILLKKLSEDRVSWVRAAACDVAHNREIDLSQIPSQKKKRWPNYHGNACTLGEFCSETGLQTKLPNTSRKRRE